jgi:hypothetical protein
LLHFRFYWEVPLLKILRVNILGWLFDIGFSFKRRAKLSKKAATSKGGNVLTLIRKV